MDVWWQGFSDMIMMLKFVFYGHAKKTKPCISAAG